MNIPNYKLVDNCLLKGYTMRSIIYIVGLIVVVYVILAILGIV